MAVIMKLFSRPAALRTLKTARALLSGVTPLKSNCGRLCGGACCKPDETNENGMLLFPFEDEYYTKPIDGFPFHLADDDALFRGGKRLVCEGSCPREHRPLACRLFPLRIRIEPDELGQCAKVSAELDPRAWCCCPLLERGGMRGLSAGFIQAVEEAGNVLIGNTLMLDALYHEQAMLDEMRKL